MKTYMHLGTCANAPIHGLATNMAVHHSSPRQWLQVLKLSVSLDSHADMQGQKQNPGQQGDSYNIASLIKGDLNDDDLPAVL